MSHPTITQISRALKGLSMGVGGKWDQQPRRHQVCGGGHTWGGAFALHPKGQSPLYDF